MKRDIYSNFRFLQALPPLIYHSGTFPAGGEISGPSIDTQGFEGLTFAIETGDVDVSQATSLVVIRMMHAEDSGVGPSTYINVSAEDIIHSAYSFGDALTSGIVFDFSISGTSVADLESTTFYVGYIGTQRYVKLFVESHGTADAGSTYIGATAILGYPNNWPVTEPG
jgi:hypothetical protein